MMSKKILISILLFIFSLIILSNGYIGIDAFFHDKYSEIMPIYQADSLPWMHYTIHSEDYNNHKWLFHVFIKFYSLVFGDYGGKLMICTILIFIAYYYVKLLRFLNTANEYYWCILLFLSSIDFLIRMSMLRSHAISVLLIIMYIYYLVSSKYLKTFLVSLVSPLIYSSFIFFVTISFVDLLLNLKEYKRHLFTLFITILGCSLGFLFHPNFPDNISYLYESILQRIFFTSNIPMGYEWSGYTLYRLFYNNILFWLILVFCLVFIIKAKPAYTKHTYLFYVFFILFSILMIKSNRFIEYVVPFFILFVASLKPNILQYAIVNNKIKFNKEIIILILFVSFIQYSYTFYCTHIPYDRFREASNWLKENTEKHEIVYNVSWSDFPNLFYWNTDNYYICGLDPNFIDQYDYNVSSIYFRISAGDIQYPSEYIKKYFNANYAIVPKEYKFIRFFAV